MLVLYVEWSGSTHAWLNGKVLGHVHVLVGWCQTSIEMYSTHKRFLSLIVKGQCASWCWHGRQMLHQYIPVPVNLLIRSYILYLLRKTIVTTWHNRTCKMGWLTSKELGSRPASRPTRPTIYPTTWGSSEKGIDVLGSSWSLKWSQWQPRSHLPL